MMNKDQKKRKRKTREKKCKQKVDNRNCVKTKKHELNNYKQRKR